MNYTRSLEWGSFERVSISTLVYTLTRRVVTNITVFGPFCTLYYPSLSWGSIHYIHKLTFDPSPVLITWSVCKSIDRWRTSVSQFTLLYLLFCFRHSFMVTFKFCEIRYVLKVRMTTTDTLSVFFSLTRNPYFSFFFRNISGHYGLVLVTIRKSTNTLDFNLSCLNFVRN